MLDNLKLGYGGTKEEMQRLLEDAEKLTGKKYDISNFADITQAIHAIQTEMGITGTTAKEASTTIEGSLNSMKSSWTNLLTAFISPDMSLEDELNNFVDTVLTAGDNILPKINSIADSIVQVIPGIIGKINENLPTILQTGTEILQTLINGIETTLPSLMPMVTQLITTLLTFVTENLPL